MAFTSLGNSTIIAPKGGRLNGNAGYDAEIAENDGNQTKLLIPVTGIRNEQAHNQEDVRTAGCAPKGHWD